MAGADIGVGFDKILLELIDIVLGPGLCYVNQVIGNLPVFSQVFACAYIHPAIHLPGVRRNDFRTLYRRGVRHRERAALKQSQVPASANFLCQFHCVLSLSRCRRPQHANQVNFSADIPRDNLPVIQALRLRQLRHLWSHILCVTENACRTFPISRKYTQNRP